MLKDYEDYYIPLFIASGVCVLLVLFVTVLLHVSARISDIWESNQYCESKCHPYLLYSIKGDRCICDTRYKIGE